MGQASRCDSCVYSRIIRGYAQSEKITLCDRLFEPIRIPFAVMECTDYIDKRLPCIEDLELIAWELRSKSAGKKAGFRVAGIQADIQDEPEADAHPEQQPAEAPAAFKTK